MVLTHFFLSTLRLIPGELQLEIWENAGAKKKAAPAADSTQPPRGATPSTRGRGSGRGGGRGGGAAGGSASHDPASSPGAPFVSAPASGDAAKDA